MTVGNIGRFGWFLITLVVVTVGSLGSRASAGAEPSTGPEKRGAPAEAYVDIAYRGGAEPGVQFTSGLTIYDEALVKGRFIGRYWSADGQMPRFSVEKNVQERWALPIEAFRLEIDGQLLSSRWEWVKAYEAPVGKESSRHSIIELANTLRPITVKVHTLLDGTPVLARWLEITNTSEKPLGLSAVSCWSGLLWMTPGYHELLPQGVDNVFTLGRFNGDYWGWEGQFEWMPLANLTTRVEGRKGTGYDDPFFIVRNEAEGEYFIGHLAWSANWHLDFTCEQDPSGMDPFARDWRLKPTALLLLAVGPSASAPLRVIMLGVAVSTPAVHLGHVTGDLDTAVQAMHNHIRRSVVPPKPKNRSMLVQYLVGGRSPKTVLENIDIAADLGCEVFILDSGWNGAEPGDWASKRGDWVPHSGFADGIEPIREYVRRKGLLFGLWVEPECIHKWSNLFKEHPDWFLAREGEPVTIRGDNDLNRILDLTRPEVAAWMEAEIGRLIRQYDLDLFRLDFNEVHNYDGGRSEREGYLENSYWRYYEAFYGIIDRLRKKFPQVIFQQCAGGGARNDLGTAGRFHETYLTDGLMVPRVFKIFNGESLALPPENFVILFRDALPYGHRGPLDTQLRATFSLSTPLFSGVRLSATAVDIVNRRQWRRYIEMYKRFIRPLLSSGVKVYHHSISERAVAEDYVILEYAAPDASRALAFLVRIGAAADDVYCFRPKGLDPGRRYRVFFDSHDKWAVTDGLNLMREGIAVVLGSQLASELLLFEAQ